MRFSLYQAVGLAALAALDDQSHVFVQGVSLTNMEASISQIDQQQTFASIRDLLSLSQVGPTRESDLKNGAHFNPEFGRRTNLNHAQKNNDDPTDSKQTSISQSTSTAKSFGNGNNILKKGSKIDEDGKVTDDSDAYSEDIDDTKLPLIDNDTMDRHEIDSDDQKMAKSEPISGESDSEDERRETSEQIWREDDQKQAVSDSEKQSSDEEDSSLNDSEPKEDQSQRRRQMSQTIQESDFEKMHRSLDAAQKSIDETRRMLDASQRGKSMSQRQTGMAQSRGKSFAQSSNGIPPLSEALNREQSNPVTRDQGQFNQQSMNAPQNFAY